MLSFFRRTGGAGEIRASQVAKYLGRDLARVNPKGGFDNDICIYVKMEPPTNYPKRSYLDVLDEPKRIRWLKEHPDVKAIAASETAKELLEDELEQEVILIPQHHCNFERVVYDSHKRLGVVGCVGSYPPKEIFDVYPDFYTTLTDDLSKPTYHRRSDIVEAYKNIGIQVICRRLEHRRQKMLKNPLKIVNAASFGIPTVAYPEWCYREVEGFYTRADTPEEILEKVQNLVYDKQALIDMAEPYHIEHISKLYLSLQ